VDFFGRDEADGARLDFGHPAFDLLVPGSLSVCVSLPLQRLEEFLCKAGAILG
jgi:hypothetical protein